MAPRSLALTCASMQPAVQCHTQSAVQSTMCAMLPKAAINTNVCEEVIEGSAREAAGAILVCVRRMREKQAEPPPCARSISCLALGAQAGATVVLACTRCCSMPMARVWQRNRACDESGCPPRPPP